MNNNLWILTEERPKRNVIKNILFKFSRDNKIPCFIDVIRILPLLDNKNNFTFTYEIVGFKSNKIGKVFLKTVSGSSSFVDYLLFFQKEEPSPNDKPLYAIEETKTDDGESRNTGVFQRASKFVYLDFFYEGARKVMLYSSISQKESPTMTSIFGTRCLLTVGVEIMGKVLDSRVFTKYSSVDELISYKSSMRKAHKGNIPINISIESKSREG
jgi:hypothetical protein